jgi:hypothetical protein
MSENNNSNNQQSVVSQSLGVTRVSYVQEGMENHGNDFGSIQQALLNAGGKVSMVNGQMTVHKPQEYNQAEHAKDLGHTLAFDKSTGFTANELHDDVVVNVPGMGTARLGDLKRVGLVDENYQFVREDHKQAIKTAIGETQGDNPNGSPNAMDNTNDESNGPTIDEFSIPDQVVIDVNLEPLNQQASETFAEKIMNDAVSGNFDLGNIDIKDLETLAEASGTDVEDVKFRVGVVLPMYQKQVDDLVSKSGIEPQEFYDWAKTEKGIQLKEAMQKHLYGQTLDGYRTLLNEYFRSVPPSQEALQKAAAEGKLKMRTVGGVIQVTLPGKPETSLDNAVRLGWI